MKLAQTKIMKASTKVALAFAVSVILFLNAACASSAVTLESPNPQGGQFGQSVAISGTTAVVGAPDESGGGYSQAGHAFIIDTTTDPLTITLTSPNAEPVGNFGQSVAISGTTVVVGAPEEDVLVFPIAVFLHAGQAYVIDATSGSLISTLKSHDPQDTGTFGASVAISGTTVVVGAPQEKADGHLVAGNAYVFDAASGSLVSTLTSPNTVSPVHFGASVAISGATVVVGAPGEAAGAGNAYVFDATSGSLVSTLTSHNAVANGEFGASVAISGTTVVVGAPHETAGGNAYVFDAASGSLIRTLPSPNGGGFGASVAISGTTVVVGAPSETAGGQAFAGRAYTLDATTGTVIATLDSPYAQYKGDFGVSVAINECDPTVVVGAPGETASGQFVAGHAYLFRI